MENGILIEILNSLHKLFGLPAVQGTIDPQHLDCIQKCSEVTHFYKTECLAKCGVNPIHINQILYPINVTSSNKIIPNSTNHDINNHSLSSNNNNSNNIPRVTELIDKIKDNDNSNPENNLTEFHNELIRRIFDSGGGGGGGIVDDGSLEPNFNTFETVEINVKYFYLFAIMALTPVLVLFYILRHKQLATRKFSILIFILFSIA